MKKAQNLLNLFLLAVLTVSMFAFPAQNLQAYQDPEPALARYRVAEGNDYATRVLRDPWDMSNFTDVSQNLNNQGRTNILKNIKVENGIFSASAGGAQDNWQYFSLPSPGLWYEMMVGKIGFRYPINPNVYKCFYMRMQPLIPNGADSNWTVGWQTTGSPNGADDAVSYVRWFPVNIGLPPGSWHLYKVNLTNPGGTPPKMAWTTKPWHTLEVHPTSSANAAFNIDWVRLTDCNPVNVTVNWNAQPGQTRLWAGVGRDAKDFQAIDKVIQPGQTSETLDVQGWAPGLYRIGLEVNGQLVSINQEIEVVAAPIVRFTSPAPESGPDYAGASGNAWDMDASDVTRISCADYRFENGLLKLDTQHPATLPSGCAGFSGLHEADPKLWLRMAAPINPAQYRYLTFRMYQSGDVQRVADGMIGRLIWRDASNGCHHVSQGIPYDVGWHTYVVDLHDPRNGAAAESDCRPSTWLNAASIDELRFDPNENYTGVTPGVPAVVFHQEFDWIRLTKVAEVKRGDKFPIAISLNRTAADVSVSYFYTNNPGNPQQNRASVEAPYTNPLPRPGNRRVFLPLSSKGGQDSGVDPTMLWLTSNVAPGMYYLCAQASVNGVGGSAVTYCSDAPVNVLP